MKSFDGSLAGFIDHTVLAAGCTLDDVVRVCEETVRYRFAAVVVPPVYAADAVATMTGTGIPVCSVVSFPFGWDSPDAKREQTTRLLDVGVGEIDMVMNVSGFLSARRGVVEREISVVADVCGEGVVLKVIIETACLSSGQIAEAALLCEQCGADIVKTSTGFSSRGATVDDIRIIKSVVGERTGVKASGGIRSGAQARALIQAGATRIGCSASIEVIG
jgi:deoxyribose-phosphate aldolase